ncbi:MAG: energy coupling factor transporter S component ThiW [Deltaproteobacteria bacterium]
MKTNMKSKRIAMSVVLVAVAVALSPVFIPVGIAKCFPAQHMVNVLAAVLLGPLYAVAIAGAAGIIRNIMGLGTLLAFPGGMIGAFLAGLAYKAFKNMYLAGVGEVIGTGLLGALASVWIVAPLFMGKSMPVLTMIIAFSVSTVGGTIIGIVDLHLLRKAGIWKP